ELVCRAPRDPRRDEEPLAPAAAVRGEEHPHQLSRLEKRPRHLAVPPHGAVMAIEAAGVGHQDAEQRGIGVARAQPHLSKVEGLQGSTLPYVAKAWRTALGPAVVVVGGQGYEELQAGVEVGRGAHRGCDRGRSSQSIPYGKRK